MPINQEKYEQVILYLCKRLGGEIRGKKKLAKLLYYVDFDFFEQHQISITGDSYKALPMGPVPSCFGSVVDIMITKNMLSLESVAEREGYLPTEIYHCVTNPDESVFTGEEKKILDRVVTKYGHLTGKQLEDLSHAEAPYVGTEPRKEIPYELSFYRGTDFDEV